MGKKRKLYLRAKPRDLMPFFKICIRSTAPSPSIRASLHRSDPQPSVSKNGPMIFEIGGFAGTSLSAISNNNSDMRDSSKKSRTRSPAKGLLPFTQVGNVRVFTINSGM